MELDDDGALAAELTEQEKTDIAKHVLDLSEEKINKLLENASEEDAESFRAKIATCREIAEVIPSVRDKIRNTLKSKPQPVPAVVPGVGVGAGVPVNAGLGVGVGVNNNNDIDEDVNMDVGETDERKKRQNKFIGSLRRYRRAWNVIRYLIDNNYSDDSQNTYALEHFANAFIWKSEPALKQMFKQVGLNMATVPYGIANDNQRDFNIAKVVLTRWYVNPKQKDQAIKTIENQLISVETIQKVFDETDPIGNIEMSSFNVLTGYDLFDNEKIDVDNDAEEEKIAEVEGVESSSSSSSSDSDSGGSGSGNSGGGSASASRGGDGENSAANVPRSIYSAPSASHSGGGSLSRSRGSVGRGRGSASRGAGDGSGVRGVENAEGDAILFKPDWDESFALQDDNVSTSSSAKKQRIGRSDEDNDQDQLVKAANEKLKLPGSTHPPYIQSIINKKNAQKPLSVLEMAKLREYASDFGGMIIQKGKKPGLPSSSFSGLTPSLPSLSNGSVRSSSFLAVDPLESAQAMDATNAADVSHLLNPPREEDEDVVDNAMSAAGGGGVGEASAPQYDFTRTRKRDTNLQEGEKDPWFTALVEEVENSQLPIPQQVISKNTGKARDTPVNRQTLVNLLYPPKIRTSQRLAGQSATAKRVGMRSAQLPGGGRHFAMRAASFQRSRIAAILNSLYPIAV